MRKQSLILETCWPSAVQPWP